MLKSIIFDMDGVIIDSEPQHAKAALQVFSRHNLDVDLAYCTSYIGSSTKRMVEDTIQKFQMSCTVDELLEEMNTEKKLILREEGYHALPGVCELIHDLHCAGFHLAIASSSSHTEIERAVKALGLHSYFKHYISGAQLTNPKPAPDIFLYTLKKLGISAKEAMVVEDSENGVIAAKEAGISCVGFVNSHSGHQNLDHADVLLESFVGLSPDFFIHVYQRSHGEPVTIANTKRLIIRELSEKDIPQIYQIYQDPQVQKYIPNLSDYREHEIEKQKAYIRNVYSFFGYGLWGVYSKTTKQLIGRCGIENQMIDGKKEIALSYLLDVEHWGYGYALECCQAVLHYAFDEIGIERVVALIDIENLRSMHTAQKLDMKKEKELLHNHRMCALFVKEI